MLISNQLVWSLKSVSFVGLEKLSLNVHIPISDAILTTMKCVKL